MISHSADFTIYAQNCHSWDALETHIASQNQRFYYNTIYYTCRFLSSQPVQTIPPQRMVCQLGGKQIPRCEVAGLLALSTWRQQVGGVSSMISDTLLPTNVLNWCRFPVSWLSTMRLSIQAYVWSVGMSRMLTTWLMNLSNTMVLYNSKRGIMSHLIGAT